MLVYIQVLGFLAAFAVVAFHAWGVTPQGYKVPDNFVPFVLSGGGRGMSMVTLIPGIPPRLLVLAISCIVAALGLLLNISVERPSLKLVRRAGGSPDDFRNRHAVRLPESRQVRRL